MLFPCVAYTQTYRYLGIENGLSNRRIFKIQKDSKGYMWFLTNEGMDRYDGKEIKHYRLTDGNRDSTFQIYLGWLYTDADNGLWVIGKKGRIFRYDATHDRFGMVYKVPELEEFVSYGYMDRRNVVWLCGKDSISLYDVEGERLHTIPNLLRSNITMMEQVDDTHFFIATEHGIRYTELQDDHTLRIIPLEALAGIFSQVNGLYYHRQSERLFIGTFEEGVQAYDLRTRQITRSSADLSDVNITRITPLDDEELLVATEGMGIYKVNVNTCVTEPFLIADYESYNEMNGNNINDMYVDDQSRIWVVNYPVGITVVDNRYKNYHWIKHSVGSRQSLVNDQVQDIIEDSDGDLWFGTSNGISLYRSDTGTWHSFLGLSDQQLKDKNHIFTTLCEVSPGVVWAGGYTSGIYKINKRTLAVEYFSPFLLSNNMRPDKYIRDMIKDSKGYIWSGGLYNLKCIDLKDNSVRLYPGLASITAILEKDDRRIWIGTTAGLYLLDRNTGDYETIDMPVEANYVNTLYQSDEGLLYIGTSGSGVLVYDDARNTFDHYYSDNSALISANIYTILPETDGYIVMSTEDGLTCFYTKEKIFRNWTKEQGLIPACFNPSSGTLRKKGGFVLGSIDGAVEFPDKLDLPGYDYSKMVLSEFQISYQPVYPGDEESPLTEGINETEELRLNYDQNTFSLRVSSINYDFPSNVLYTWKLEGFYDEWIKPSTLNLVRFTNLNAGEYTLRIRAMSKEDPGKVFEERALRITIARPAWLSYWAIAGYVIVALLIYISIFRYMTLRKEQRISKEQTRFFINTAHDIRTPLTLIKAPLEEISEKEDFTKRGRKGMKIALQNVDALLRLTTNLINFERTNVYTSELYIGEYDLDTYLAENFEAFRSYAQFKHLQYTYHNEAGHLKVWFDKEKMDSILKNVLSNAMKYTPENGAVSLMAMDMGDSWQVEVEDTGIGLSLGERRNLFKIHFRGTNAINSKITGSGIGLMLVRKLVRLHGGQINFESEENEGTVVKISIPKDKERFRKYKLAEPGQPALDTPLTAMEAPVVAEETPQAKSDIPQRILVVEDNDELRSYLADVLADDYTVQTCGNGKEALVIVKEFQPELVLSDIMMPQMGGDELCIAIKRDIETSHIPVLLLTALGDEKNILEGLNIGADAYITKPFNLRLLKANIANLLANRALLRKKFADMEAGEEILDETATSCATALDWKFISDVHKNIEKNMDNTDFTVDTLCALQNMSRSSFYNKLKALTGQAPADYIRLIRLKRAAELLKSGAYSVTEVSEMTGFGDSKYFREVFKKHFNVSPSKYGK